MSRQLLILRHGKSAWDTNGPNDFERPLTKRGEKDASRIGHWIKTQGFFPEHIISSPALRAKQTVCMVARELNVPEDRICWDKRVYMADVPTLLKVLSEAPLSANTALLVGHNPGLEDLLVFLCDKDLRKPNEEKRFPTAALAQLILPNDWRDLKPHIADLLVLIRPRILKKDQ